MQPNGLARVWEGESAKSVSVMFALLRLVREPSGWDLGLRFRTEHSK